MGIIKQNDIRGIYPGELSSETVYSIGYYLPEILETNTILVGRDSRVSSNSIFESLAQGITDAGCDVVDIGLCDTPAVYFATAYYKYRGSVMITASHNPPDYNGLKISRSMAIPVSPETGLNRLKECIKTSPNPVKARGTISYLDIQKDYVDHVLSFATGEFRDLKMVIDCGNGGSVAHADRIFKSLNPLCQIINDDADGTFPNHGPNPLDRSSMKQIREELLKEKADIGILFDGDGDRAIFFDEKGHFISPDLITSLLGHRYYNDSNSGGTMFYDIRSSRSVAEYIDSLGGDSAPCPSGHANIKRLLRETEGLYAGELSGHYYFKDNFYCDSGFIAAVAVLSILDNLGQPLSRIASRINPYSFSGEISFKVENQEHIMNTLPSYFREGQINDLDGVRIDFKKWWFILRPSGAEPLLRLVVEAEEERLMKEKVGELKKIIASLDVK